MHIELSGKTARVSASTGGPGLAIAKGLAHSGANVIVNGRREASVQRAIRDIQRVAPGVQCYASTAA